jgi:hypothetical protein
MIELVGKKILDVEVGNSESLIRFTIENGDPLIYVCEGDCCSETWFSEILNLDFLINHTVSEVRELDMPRYDDGNTRQEHDQLYGYKIATEAGHCAIVFRNSSNGYYGGSYDLDDSNEDRPLREGHGWKSIKHIADWVAYEPVAKRKECVEDGGGEKTEIDVNVIPYHRFLRLQAFC